MSEQRQGDVITGEIHDVQGQAAIGKDIHQTYVAAPPTAEELKRLTDAFAALRKQVEEQAAPDVREEAVRQADALEEATLGPEPNVSVMTRVEDWFLEHAPGLMGAVTGVILNPIVGKVVKAAGDAVATAYREQFPRAPA